VRSRQPILAIWGQETFYVGTQNGVERFYQQTYVDTYCKLAHANLYTTKTPITAVDLLNDRALTQWSDAQGAEGQ